MPLSNRNLVNANRFWRWTSRPPKLLPHVRLLQRLDRVPIQTRLLRHIPDRHRPASSPHKESKSLRVERIVGKKGELLLSHLPAMPTTNTPNRKFQIDSGIPAREVPNTTGLSIVQAPMNLPARTTSRFFWRRTKVITRALGSPKIP